MWDCGYCVAVRWVPQEARYEKLTLNSMTLYLRFFHSLQACTSVGLLITFPQGLERTSYWRFNVHGQIGILTIEPCVFKVVQFELQLQMLFHLMSAVSGHDKLKKQGERYQTDSG